MGDLNRREAQKATIVRMNEHTRSDLFDNDNIQVLTERLRLLKVAYEKFCDIHLTIVEQVVGQDGLQVQNESFATIEELYIQTASRITIRINALHEEFDDEELGDQGEDRENQQDSESVLGDGNQNATNGAFHQNRPHEHNGASDTFQTERTGRNGTVAPDFQLERIKLQTFSGEQDDWSEWKAVYDSLVHNHPALSDTQKFHYLRRSVNGPAASILKGWHAIGTNYQEAYSAVLKVYENKYRLIMSHLYELYKMPVQTHESFNGLRSLIDTTTRVVRQLRVAGSPVDNWDDILVFSLIVRMSSRTLSFWENSQDLIEMPKLETVLKFLEKRTRSHQNLSQTSHTSETNEQMTSSTTTGAKPKFKPNNNKPSTQYQSNEKQNSIGCNNCQQPHPMYRCAKFLALSIEQRKNRVRELNLCWNCFSPNHRANSVSCKSGPCRRCNKGLKHNTLLCSVPVASTNALSVSSAQFTPQTRWQQNETSENSSFPSTSYQPPKSSHHSANCPQNFQYSSSAERQS